MQKLISIVALALLTASSADAFRPSLKWILSKAAIAQIDRKVSTLKIEQDVTIFGLKSAPRGFQTTQKTWLRAPYAIREETVLPEGKRISVFTAEKSLSIKATGERKARRAGPNFFAHLTAGGGPNDKASLAERLMRDLEAYGIDTQKISHGRFDGRIAFVIGAKPFESNKPQVWLDKDTYHPLRVIVAGKVSGKQIVREVRFMGWGSSEAGGWYPKIIERLDDGVLKERAVTKSAERNKTFERGLFATEE